MKAALLEMHWLAYFMDLMYIIENFHYRIIQFYTKTNISIVYAHFYIYKHSYILSNYLQCNLLSI